MKVILFVLGVLVRPWECTEFWVGVLDIILFRRRLRFWWLRIYTYLRGCGIVTVICRYSTMLRFDGL